MTTSPDWLAELQEALWETGKDFGVQLQVGQQLAIARALSQRRIETVTPADVQAAFAAIKLPRPPAAYAKAVLASVRGVAPLTTILDVLVDFRAFAIRSLSRQFGGKTRAQEDALRNYLLTYLPKRGYTEARTGKGQTDILLPPPDDTIIETKVWTNERDYRDGLEELRRYIHTEQPKEAAMVVFGDRDPLPSIVLNHRQAVAATEHLEGLAVPIVVVPFEVDAPSKAGRRQRAER